MRGRAPSADRQAPEAEVQSESWSRMVQPPDAGLRVLPAPREIRRLDSLMAWHPRLDGDLGQRRLRDTVRAVTAELPEAAM